MPRLTLLLAAVSVATLQACAPRGLASAPASARDRACTVVRDPAVLPSPGDLLDVGRFRADANRLWSEDGRPRGAVVFSLRHAADGAQVRRAVIESTVDTLLADSLQRLVFAHRRQAPASAAEWAVRLRVELGDSMALAVGRPVECAARPREWAFRASGGSFDVREGDAMASAAQPPTDAGTVWVRVRVDASGQVTDARVERGIRRGGWEERLLNWVRTQAFDPATEDGYPVPAELTLPVRLSAVP
ncbi:MAG TPA: energy transducer TonB [Longimicrobiaceae bacterium]|nr:energy transducer TonB [Longimicrobiaceae bacterium]